MKTLILASLLFGSMGALADDPKVDITSFRMAGVRTRAAELCGKLTGVKAFPASVKVIVDPSAKSPGIYNVAVWEESTFCVAVMTDFGVADAVLRGGKEEIVNSSVASFQ